MSETTNSTRPTTVTVSFFLWLITILLSIVGAILVIALSGSAGIAEGTDTAAGTGTGVYVTAGIITIVLAVVELIVVFKMRAGRNWARIVLLVLAVLQIASTATQGGSGNVSSWGGIVFVIIATVLMFLPTSNPYFTQKGLTAQESRGAGAEGAA